MKKKIVLHIGHGKTGTSAIQSVLARNHALLKRHRILYPEHPSFADAQSGRITSGNLDPDDWFEGQVMAIARASGAYDAFLFSNENVFYRMDEFLDGYARYRDEYDFEIILFVRNPFDKLQSGYQQAVKRSGFAGDIRAFAESDSDTVLAAALIERLHAQHVPTRIFNYSMTGTRTVETFLRHLGLWDLVESGDAADAGAVNRSLGFAELGLILHINQIFGAQYGALLSDALINRLPDLRSDAIPIDAETIALVQARNAAAVEAINAHLDAASRLDLAAPAPSSPSWRHDPLSGPQAAVIREAFPHAFVHADAVVLRDIAMKYERGERLTKKDAIALMGYAHRIRPHGRIIAGKLAEWRAAPDDAPATTWRGRISAAARRIVRNRRT